MLTNDEKDSNKTVGEILEEFWALVYPEKQVVCDPKVFYTVGKGRETLIIETESSDINGEIMQRTVTEKQRNILKEIGKDEIKSEHKPLGQNTNIIISYFLNERGKRTGKIRSLKIFDFMEQELTDNEEEDLDNLNIIWELQPSNIVLETSAFIDKLKGVIRYKIFRFMLLDYCRDYETIKQNLKEISILHKKFYYLPKALGDHYKHVTKIFSNILYDYFEEDNEDLIDWDIDSFMEFDVHLKENTKNT